MKRTAIVLAVAGLLAMTAAQTTAQIDDVLPTERYIIGFYEPPRVGDTYNGDEVVATDTDLNFIVVLTRNPLLTEARAKLDAAVRYVEWDNPNYAILDMVPNDSQYNNAGHWGSKKIGAEAAWDVTIGSTAVKVGMLDSGLYKAHEEFTGQSRVLQGWDFQNNDNNPNDESGCSWHGSHTTGTAGATINNGKGIAGMSQHTVLPVKAFYPGALGCTAGTTPLVNALKYMGDQGAHISSNSWGSSASSTVLNDAVQYSHDRGTIHIAAAGNSGPCTNCVSYPWKDKASITIVVASTTSSDTQSSFSSEGTQVDVAAPGSSIISLCGTSTTCYQTISGTSMATPHVAGAAALVKAVKPTFVFSDIDNCLKTTALDLGPVGVDTDFGSGRIRADQAVNCGGAPPPAACGDGVDNDGDGLTDYPADPGCTSSSDTDEFNAPACGGPANNCFASAAALSGTATVTTTGATTETGEPLPCGSMGATVWYTWTAPASGTATVDTVGGSTNYDTVLAAYTGSSLTGLTNLACNDDASGTQSQITFACTAGTTYRIQLGGWQAATGTATVDVSGCAGGGGGGSLNENFDDGAANGWTLTGLWRVSGACTTSEPSAPNVLNYNQAPSPCTYATGARTTGTATTSGVDISAAANPTVSFSHQYIKENYAGGDYDIMRVRVQTAGSSTWTTLWQRDSTDADQSTWTTLSLSLSSYKSTATKVQFYFDSVDGTANSYLGWVIDNVVIQ